MAHILVLCSRNSESTYYRMWPGEYPARQGLVANCIRPKANQILPCPTKTLILCTAQNNGVLCYFYTPKFRDSRNYPSRNWIAGHSRRCPWIGYSARAPPLQSDFGSQQQNSDWREQSKGNKSTKILPALRPRHDSGGP